MKAILLAIFSTIVAADVLQAAPALSGWYAVGPTDPAKVITVRLSLKKDMRAIERKVLAASTPGSPSFREWATHEEVLSMRRLATPVPVLQYFRSAGIPTRLVGDSIVAEMTTAQVESIFRTTVSDYKDDNGQVWHRAGDLHAPVEISSLVAAVYGLHGLPLPPRKPMSAKARAAKTVQNSPNIGPGDLRRVYSVPASTRGASGAPRQAVAEFQGQFANQQDLTSFFQQYVPYAQPGDETVFAYKGNQGTGYGVEALLDIQYIMGVAPGVKTEFWGWRNFDFCTDLKNWTSTIIGDSDPPMVFSISYGWQGDLSQIGCQGSQVTDIDNDLQTIAAKGISIIFASGDSGSQQSGGQLWASWPASSNWVTAVGATCFTDSTMSTQSASTQFGSGSGFSSMFTQAPFQRSAVQAYLSAQASSLPPSSYFNATGRATADVSALGEGFQVVIDGQTEIVGGTSASTPTFAGIVSLLNAALYAKSQKPLGFLNPWIYSTSSGFTDITIGSDKISRSGTPFQYGFNCATGWDPATGVGTPIFTNL